MREELLKEARTRVVFGPAGSFGASPNGDYRAGAGFQLGYDEVEFHGLRPTQVGFSLGAMYRYGHSDLVTSINRTLPGETHGFELVPTGVFFWLGNSVAGVRFQFLPTAFGYSLATAENDEKFHLLTLRTGGGPRLDLNAGPLKLTLSGEVAAECGLDMTAGDCLVPWKLFGGSTLSMEFVVRDWDPWLIDPLGENDRRPPPSNSKLEAE
ncbi:MAG: hypothetical protein HOV80_29765 [Polyangiaceae bacterium]|nr:hypothetical protein [Polyangiaceae bacterium]